QNEGRYLFSTMGIHLLLCTTLILPAYFFLNQQVNGIPFWYFFFMTFGITLFDLLKKFVFSRERISINYGLISTFVLNIIFFFGLFNAQSLGLTEILEVFWVSFFIADLLLLFFFIKKGVFSKLFIRPLSQLGGFFKEIFLAHYHYAKWIL